MPLLNYRVDQNRLHLGSLVDIHATVVPRLVDHRKRVTIAVALHILLGIVLIRASDVPADTYDATALEVDLAALIVEPLRQTNTGWRHGSIVGP